MASCPTVTFVIRNKNVDEEEQISIIARANCYFFLSLGIVHAKNWAYFTEISYQEWAEVAFVMCCAIHKESLLLTKEMNSDIVSFGQVLESIDKEKYKDESSSCALGVASVLADAEQAMRQLTAIAESQSDREFVEKISVLADEVNAHLLDIL